MAEQKSAETAKQKKTGGRRTDEPRKRRTSAENRERLIRAASDEFRKFGFAGATTAAIARSAGVTETQLFRYYPTKADLFREAVFEPLNAHFSEFNARNQSSGAENGGDRDLARLYVSELQAFLDEHSKLLASLIVAQTFTSGSLQGVGDIDSLRGYFERGAAMMSRRVQDNPAVEPRLLVRVSFAAVLGCVMFKEWIFPAEFAADDEINAAIFDFVIDGINVNADARLKSPKKPAVKKTRAKKISSTPSKSVGKSVSKAASDTKEKKVTKKTAVKKPGAATRKSAKGAPEATSGKS